MKSEQLGDRYSAGFASGFAGSILSPLASYASTTEGKVTIQAVIGGTASAVGGGKFANGAVSAAFVAMYNEMAHEKVKEKQEVSIDIDRNIKKILWLRKHGGIGSAKYYFYNKVRPFGDWDYKRIYGLKLGEAIGNFNYGATGAAAGFELETLLRAAGFVQEFFGAYDESYGHFYGGPPYGDQKEDQDMIRAGYSYYEAKYL